MTALTTVDQLADAPKFRLGIRGNSFNGSTAERHYLKGMSASAFNAFTDTNASPAAFGSNGTLFNKTSTGFPNFPTYSGLTPYLYASSLALHTGGGAFLAEIVDVVWACTGFNGTSAVAQNIPAFPAYTRGDANGEGLDLYIFTATTAGSTSITVTVSYTNTAGTAGRSAVKTLEASALTAPLTYLVPRQAGDTGVQSIQSLTFSATSGAAGSVGLALVRSLGWVGGGGAGLISPANSRVPFRQDWQQVGLQQLDNDAALSTIGHSNSSPNIVGGITLAYV